MRTNQSNHSATYRWEESYCLHAWRKNPAVHFVKSFFPAKSQDLFLLFFPFDTQFKVVHQVS